MTAATTQPAYGVAYICNNVPGSAPAGARLHIWLCLENRGSRVWQQSRPATNLAIFLNGVVLAMAPLPRENVRENERVTLSFPLRLPSSEGHGVLRFQLVEQGVTWFEDQGVESLCVPVEIGQPDSRPSTRLLEASLQHNCWFYQPDGAEPIYAKHAGGYRITDVEDREYIDYVMGWGCALLGYGHPRIRKALARAIDSGAVLTVPHRDEIQLSEMLAEAIPCAEMTLFGKNGSDVTTAAARLARAVTGRSMIVFSGYLGWQDWNSEDASRAVPFSLHDLPEFIRLMELYKGDVAAVMIEPAAQVESIGGPIREADAGLLGAIAKITRDAGALLVFDELITGFRYPGGSVQQATGVIPDLACFGKALSAGMPLSALVGRRDIFQAGMGRTHYDPTYKGEAYSIAAAIEALHIYREEDVAGYVWAHGERLRSGINERFHSFGVPAEISGVPFRMTQCFRHPDADRSNWMRTLLNQELLKNRIITFKGLMLPSYAHDGQAIEITLRAFEAAAAVVARADREDAFARYLQIPELR